MIYSLYHPFIALQQTGVLRSDLAIAIIEHDLHAYLMCDIGDRRGPDVFDFDLSVYAEMTQNEDHHPEKRDGHCKQYQVALVRHGNELQSVTACGAMPDTTYLLLLHFQFSEEQKE